MCRFITSIAVLAAFIGHPALAEDTAKKEPTRIEIDQQTGRFLFIVKDEPVAMLDETGLHVVGEINYGLYLTDTGPDAIKAKIASDAKEAADE